jgi:hypothetical protein
MKADPLSISQGLPSRAEIQQIGMTCRAAVSLKAAAKPPLKRRIASSLDGWLGMISKRVLGSVTKFRLRAGSSYAPKFRTGKAQSFQWSNFGASLLNSGWIDRLWLSSATMAHSSLS